MSAIRGDEYFQSNRFPISTFPDIACYAALLVPKNENNIIVLRLDDHTLYYDYCLEWQWCINIDNETFWCLPIRAGSIGFLVRETEMIQHIFSIFDQKSIETHFNFVPEVEMKRVYECITTPQNV
jgi:hypothetical protein